MRRSFGCWTALCLCLAISGGWANADDWQQFRGNGDGIANGNLPTEWNRDANVRWKSQVPGVAWSAPIVVGNKVIVTTAVTDNQPRPAGDRGGARRGSRQRPGSGRTPDRRDRRERFSAPRPGQVVPPFLAERLSLSAEQTTKLATLQALVDKQLAGILTVDQKKRLTAEPASAEAGRRRFGRPPQPGTLVSSEIRQTLELDDSQQGRLDELQKEASAGLLALLTPEQREQWQSFTAGRRRGGGPGGRGPGQRQRQRQPPEDIYRWEIHCLDRSDGRTLWTQRVRESRPEIPTQSSNTYATETPVTDGERVYAYFGMHGLFCYDLGGKFVWKADLGAYPMAAGWGTASSPVLAGDRILVLCDNEESSFLVALDKRTGQELWRTARTESTTYASPFVWRNKSRTEIIALGSPYVRSYDPSTGKQLWQLAIGEGRCSATPVGDSELLLVGLDGSRGGRGRARGGPANAGGLFAVRAGASGQLDDNLESAVAWNAKQDSLTMASPLLYQGHVYLFSHNGGIVTCLDAKSGSRLYRKRLPGAGAFWASPWAAEGKIYCLDDAGTTHVLAAGPTYQLVSQNKLEAMTWASAAAANGEIFVRSVDHLYCIADVAKPTGK